MTEFLGITKPSQALRAMRAGLLATKDNDLFEVDMGSFGKSADGEVCFGCAATCTLQELSGRVFLPRDVGTVSLRAYFIGVGWGRLKKFEKALDAARQGSLLTLFSFFECEEYWKNEYDFQFRLDTNNWFEQVPKVVNLAELLESRGY